MKHFSVRRIVIASAVLLGGAGLYFVWPALEPMPDDTPLRVNLPDTPDGAGTLRLLEYRKRMKEIKERSERPEIAEAVSYIKAQLEAGFYGEAEELRAEMPVELDEGNFHGEYFLESFVQMLLMRKIPWDAVAVQKILSLPENRELCEIFDEETDFRESFKRSRENLLEEPLVFIYAELVDLCCLKIREELARGDIGAARKRFGTLYSLLLSRGCEASDALSLFLLEIWKQKLEGSIADFFLGKNQPDSETIDFLRQTIATGENVQPDYHEIMRLEFNFGLTLCDSLIESGTDVSEFLFGGPGEAGGAWTRFRMRGYKKAYLKEVLPFLPDLEAKLPLDKIIKKYENRRESLYRRFRSEVSIYGAFSLLEAKEVGLNSVITRILHFSETRLRENRVSKIMLACYEYRQKHGTFPQTLDELVPAYLECVPECVPCSCKSCYGNSGIYMFDSKTRVVFPSDSIYGGELDVHGDPKSAHAFVLPE